MRKATFFVLAISCFVFSNFQMPWEAGNSNNACAQEIGFLEEFVLATDREAILKKLVPGTERYYYYHALHHQNNQDLEKVEELLKPWIKRFGETQRVTQIKNRQALLKYSDDPKETLAYLTKKLQLRFTHQREIPQTQRDLASKLDPNLVSTERLISAALRNSNTSKFTDKGLLLLAGKKLSKTQRRHLLTRLKHPDFPGLVELVVADLKERDSRGFGSISIHQQMTLKQMEELAKQFPKLKIQSNYVNNYLRKLIPSEDVDWRADRVEHRKYLERLWAYSKTLNPNFNSLKACVLYRQLELDRDEGIFDREKFMAYLALPRNIGYVKPELIKGVSSRSHIVQLNANYSTQIRLMPINNDESLVQDYLHHFLKDARNTTAFQRYVRDEYLNRQYAIAKIVNGIGDTEKWASLLSPEQYKQVLDRIDVEFLSTNPEFFDVDDKVELDLKLKNVDNLIVKVFEINTSNYYRKHRKEVDTDVNLDGLVPNFEKTYSYTEPPAIRKKHKFEFPQIKDRGVYVVDFIAGGKSSRALIRKGRLQISDQVTPVGQLFTVIDQAGSVVMDADLWIGGARYYADKQGKILVPFSTNPGRVDAIITQNNFSCLQTFNHMPENYSFKAAMVIDRENLTRSNKARVLIRPSLQIVGGNPVPVAMLKEPKLVVTSVNLDGISSTKVIDDIKFTESAETICEFVVPPRLRTISLALSVEVKVASQGRTMKTTANQSFSISTIDQSDVIQDVHLMPTDKGYFLEVLGKSGEIRRKQAVRVRLRFENFSSEVSTDLQTDEAGLIELGSLNGVASIKVNPAGGADKTWQLATQDQTYYQTMHAVTGSTIELPAPAGVVASSRESISLFEKRGGTYVKDHFDSVVVKDGLVKISDLPAGDYELRLTYTAQRGSLHYRNVNLRVTAGKQADNVLVGKHRHLEARGNKALHLSKVSMNKDKLRIQLDNVDKFTRLHVIANRYQPSFNAFNQFSQISDLEPWMRRPSLRRSVYMEGRKIGDEYEYILRRKYAEKYPGNMLERPSLILNPWEVQATSNGSQDAQEGDDFGRVGTESDKQSKRGKKEENRSGGNADFANLDYLGEGAVLLSNLVPKENGIVTIDRAKLGNNQHIRIVALNAFQTIQRNVDLPLKKLKPTDSRLAQALDPDSHFSQSKQTEVLSAGDKLVIEDIVSAKFQQYDDLSDVYQLMLTLNSGTHLAKFEFVLTWKDQTEEKKNELYSKHACHELNFFLMKKDKAYFDKVVVPHLKNKRDKTFMDQWLLKENLDEFASPWKYARLNTVERILLAQRLEGRTADITRNLNEQYLLRPTTRTQFDGLYDTTIRGLGLMDSGLKYDASKPATNLPRLSAMTASPSQSGGLMGGAMMDDDAKDSSGGPGGGGMGGGGRGRGMVGQNMDSFAADEVAELREESESINGDFSAGAQLIKKRKRLDPNPELLGRRAGRTLMRSETRTRTVPVTRMRTESRTRKLANGRTETYQVQVPYTENVTQNYTVQVPEFLSGGEIPIQITKGKLAELEKQRSQLYRRLSPTKEWMENNYYQLRPEQQSTNLVQINRFWRDYANHDGGTFLSPYFSEAHRTFTEMMFALSVLDLPLESPKQNMEYVNNSMTFTADGPTIALHQQVRDAIFDRGNTTVLVSENFFQKNDRYRHEEGVRYDKFVAGDFLAHTLYGSQVVITNPTSTPRAVDLLIQIPLGSVACSGAQETRTIQMDLAAFSTKTFEYAFYFPTAGDFGHYPAHVSAEEKVLAVADNVTFKVVDEPAKVDKTSWEFVSQNGTEDEVLEFLNQQNVLRLDLNKIAFRMKDKSFFQRAIKSLRNRYVFNSVIWSYGVMHNDEQTIGEYLTQENRIASQCGVSFESDLLTINPVERSWYAHKEYWPLINDRAHQLGPQRKILNPNFFGQYQNLLGVLSNRRELSDDDHLVIAYYMLLQDRIDTSLAHFGKVNKDSLPSQIQYDYCDAYLDMYREKPNEAAAKAAKWADYPVDLWRNRFKNILAQVDEIRGGQVSVVDKENNLQTQTDSAAKSESFDFRIESGVANIKFQNIKEIQVNFYEMDIELLFSRSPFAQDELDGFSMIRPNVTKTVSLKVGDNGKGTHKYELPTEMRNKNVLVEIVAGDQTKSQPYFAHSLDVQLLEKFGQVHVTDEKTGKAISKTYVKVYARMNNGSVKFHKDGYTDLRGRFDYVSQSNKSIDGIQKFSILVLSEDKGAVIRQSDPPKE